MAYNGISKINGTVCKSATIALVAGFFQGVIGDVNNPYYSGCSRILGYNYVARDAANAGTLSLVASGVSFTNAIPAVGTITTVAQSLLGQNQISVLSTNIADTSTLVVYWVNEVGVGLTPL
jgi:hypothetical protein